MERTTINKLPFTGPAAGGVIPVLSQHLLRQELTSMCKGMEAASCGLANAVVELIRAGTGADVSVVSNRHEWLPVAAGSAALYRCTATISMGQYCNSNRSDLCKLWQFSPYNNVCVVTGPVHIHQAPQLLLQSILCS